MNNIYFTDRSDIIKYLKYVILLIITLVLTGCGVLSNEKILDNFIKKIESAETYSLTGDLEMINNETNYKYDVTVDYMKEDFFKVSLKNKTNNHEQIIIKNKDGVFVVTPSLNKSFKFQSDWPYNNSQSYLLQSIIGDLKKDKNIDIIKNKNKEIIYESNVNYINNIDLKKQKVYINEEGDLLKVEVLNTEGQAIIKMEFKEINYNKKFKDEYFSLDENISISKIEENTNILEDVVYPLYIPKNTKLTSHENIEDNENKRVILDFTGDSSFTLIQEKVNNSEIFETTLASGEPLIIGNVFGNLEKNSLNWYDQGVEYFIASENLSENELVKVALSINNTNLVK